MRLGLEKDTQDLSGKVLYTKEVKRNGGGD